jgi:hypothetical protein
MQGFIWVATAIVFIGIVYFVGRAGYRDVKSLPPEDRRKRLIIYSSIFTCAVALGIFLSVNKYEVINFARAQYGLPLIIEPAPQATESENSSTYDLQEYNAQK